MENNIDISPEDIQFHDSVFDIDFHPDRNVVAAGLVDGTVELYEYNHAKNLRILKLNYHQDSCRCVLFSKDGNSLYTASSDNSIRAVDTNGSLEWAEVSAHSAPVNALHTISNNVFASGDDDGVVKLWDTRQRSCLVKWHEHDDFISDITCNSVVDHLVVTSGDGTLSCFDLRKNTMEGRSDDLEDELLSVVTIKNDKKIICGSQDGVLVVFNWGDIGDMSDRFPGHPQSVETILKLDEDTICTGSSDGIIRIVQIHPNKLLGVVGDHEDFPVEVIKFSRDKKFIGSVSHMNRVHFWDVGYLFEQDTEDDSMSVDEEPANYSSSGNRKLFSSTTDAFFSDL